MIRGRLRAESSSIRYLLFHVHSCERALDAISRCFFGHGDTMVLAQECQ